MYYNSWVQKTYNDIDILLSSNLIYNLQLAT